CSSVPRLSWSGSLRSCRSSHSGAFKRSRLEMTRWEAPVSGTTPRAHAAGRTPSPVSVTVVIHVKPGYRDELLRLLCPVTRRHAARAYVHQCRVALRSGRSDTLHDL